MMNFIDNQLQFLTQKENYRIEIDGLRAFAVIAVIINHIDKKFLSSGYLGVDIFFVISGFVITSSLLNKKYLNFKDFIFNFYERRIKRLIPVLIVVVFLSILVYSMFSLDQKLSIRTGIASLFGMSNLYLFKQATNYFGQSEDLQVFTHTWSLGVEEQFYLLFPFITWSTGFSRFTRNGIRNFLILIIFFSILSLIAFINLYDVNQPAAYFLMPARFWELSAGCITFIIARNNRKFQAFLKYFPSGLIILLIIFLMTQPTSNALLNTISIVLLTSLLIPSFKKNTYLYSIFTNKYMIFLGLISYSLYLWHWPILAISRWTVGIHWWTLPFQLILMIILSSFSYIYIEKPFRNIKIANIKSTFLKTFSTLLAISSLIFSLDNVFKNKLYVGKKIKQEEEFVFDKGEDCLTNISKYTNCFILNRNGSESNIWMIGDSHSGSLTKTGELIAKKFNRNLKLFTADATPFPAIGHYRKKDKSSDLKRIEDYRYLQNYLINNIKINDIVIITMNYPMHFGGSYYEYPASDFVFLDNNNNQITQEKYLDLWTKELINLAKNLKYKNINFIIQTTTPAFADAANKYCKGINDQWFNKFSRKDCKIEKGFFLGANGIHSKINQWIINISNKQDNIYLLDTFSLICPNENCIWTDLYMDDDHLSYEGSKKILAPEFIKLIKNISN